VRRGVEVEVEGLAVMLGTLGQDLAQRELEALRCLRGHLGLERVRDRPGERRRLGRDDLGVERAGVDLDVPAVLADHPGRHLVELLVVLGRDVGLRQSQHDTSSASRGDLDVPGLHAHGRRDGAASPEHVVGELLEDGALEVRLEAGHVEAGVLVLEASGLTIAVGGLHAGAQGDLLAGHSDLIGHLSHGATPLEGDLARLRVEVHDPEAGPDLLRDLILDAGDVLGVVRVEALDDLRDAFDLAHREGASSVSVRRRRPVARDSDSSRSKSAAMSDSRTPWRYGRYVFATAVARSETSVSTSLIISASELYRESERSRTLSKAEKIVGSSTNSDMATFTRFRMASRVFALPNARLSPDSMSSPSARMSNPARQ